MLAKDSNHFPFADSDILQGDLTAQPRALVKHSGWKDLKGLRFKTWSMLPECIHLSDCYLNWSARHWDDLIYFSFGLPILDQSAIKFKSPASIDSVWRLGVQLRRTDADGQTVILAQVSLPRAVVRDHQEAVTIEELRRSTNPWSMKRIITSAQQNGARELIRSTDCDHSTLTSYRAPQVSQNA